MQIFRVQQVFVVGNKQIIGDCLEAQKPLGGGQRKSMVESVERMIPPLIVTILVNLFWY
jgi:hypothetical protein